MYDAAIINENGIEYWHSPECNNANNSHSVTKLFVSTAVGILCDRGALSLDAPVTSFFSDSEKPEKMDPRWNKVTVRDALRHKTGIDEIPYNVDSDDDTGFIGNDFLKYVFSLEISRETGEYRRYSDEAYYLLARIIEKASGTDGVTFFRENMMNPLGFRQWSMACCPMGHPIGGGGFFCRADDAAKLGYAFACGGIYNGKRILSSEYIDAAMKNDYACTRHRDTDVFVKTGAKGQMVAFTKERGCAVAWHGFSNSGNARNDRLLDAFLAYLEAGKK